MRCSLCDKVINDGEEVTLIQEGELVGGEFAPTEEDRIQHYECGDLEGF